MLQSLDLAKVVLLEVIEDESEVFEASADQNPNALDQALTTMDETLYKARVRAVKLAERCKEGILSSKPDRHPCPRVQGQIERDQRQAGCLRRCSQ